MNDKWLRQLGSDAQGSLMKVLARQSKQGGGALPHAPRVAIAKVPENWRERMQPDVVAIKNRKAARARHIRRLNKVLTTSCTPHFQTTYYETQASRLKSLALS